MCPATTTTHTVDHGLQNRNRDSRSAKSEKQRKSRQERSGGMGDGSTGLTVKRQSHVRGLVTRDATGRAIARYVVAVCL
jgi:hypothetical protein